MKKIETLRQLQLVGIYIYKELLAICEQNGLSLYLTAGTLLGAVRHKGFIPWDDDIDVCMNRPDYNKLIEITHCKIGEKCRLIDPETDNLYRGCVPVVVYNNSHLTSKQFLEPEDLKIGISLFVYDGVPKCSISRFFYYSRMYILRAEHALCRANFKHVTTNVARVFGPILSPFYSSKSTMKYKNKIISWQKKYSYETSQYVSTNADKDAWKQVCLKQAFEIPVRMHFEGIESTTFSNYSEHLTRYYGNYMKLPPVAEQMPKHSFEVEIDDNFIF